MTGPSQIYTAVAVDYKLSKNIITYLLECIPRDKIVYKNKTIICHRIGQHLSYKTLQKVCKQFQEHRVETSKVGTPQNGKSQIRLFTKTVNTTSAKHFFKSIVTGQ
jgi:hypothetical protein